MNGIKDAVQLLFRVNDSVFVDLIEQTKQTKQSNIQSMNVYDDLVIGYIYVIRANCSDLLRHIYFYFDCNKTLSLGHSF